ncbi:DNA-N1-methyladenine dioxygenase [Pasteurella testudinis DSM 23072]|uniref:DNA-N1-methyladenine dioxygenase n=1 Tax=Pasteurella testudinis DSM 23072 TaxID=1122938 RepID=A0A1W1V6U3_9PAST|nr:alpha-ketoglutarate-dependent dioxygenase AlkB [Pasteurella testudinis]SMB89137.1 DNA-N1-methyladenine dioxygenase [Pasteurella testudinis DSM 23072]SUB50192.1 alpha-ketoglutarate-dependent dioxygenase AlkB [Pasteurella testudinis]
MANLDLFDSETAVRAAPDDNLLPYDGIVNDYGVVFEAAATDAYFYELLNHIPWRHDEAVMFGKHITTARKVAWYGDQNFHYRYSGATRTALPWNETLLALKQQVETLIQPVSPTGFNSCLLNLYHHGNEGMAWHSDDEACLGKNAVIASLSFGATRKFAFKHRRTGEKRDMLLQHGQLLVMRGSTQSHWLHAIMKTTKVHEPRINLTFRTMVEGA